MVNIWGYEKHIREIKYELQGDNLSLYKRKRLEKQLDKYKFLLEKKRKEQERKRK